MTNRDTCFNLVPNNYPITISKEEDYSDFRIIEGHFLSPFVTNLPGIVPKESETAYFQVLLPKKWNSSHYKPICLHLAGTGDHGFWRRRQMMAKPLLKEGGIASIILENPFYGLRKPKDQVRSSLHNVTDIIVMGGCLILESLVLFHWCENNGFGPLGVTGMSMGGHMASLAATNWPKPIVLVPCLSWSSATPVFTQGVLSHSINWKLLGAQYFSDDVFREEIRKLVEVNKDAFQAGQHFAKYYPQSMDHISKLCREQDVLNKGRESQNASPPNCKSLTTELQMNRDIDQQIAGSSLSNHQAVVSNSSVAPASDFEVHGPTSKRILSPKVDVTSVSNIGTADLMTSALKRSHLISELETSESSSVNCFNANVTSKNIPDQASKVTNTVNSLLAKQKHSDTNILTRFSESESGFLGFRNKDLKDKNSLNDASVGRVRLKENIKHSVSRWREDEAVLFMHGIMDECTHLRNFTVPVDTSLIIAICAKDDAYIPREGCADLTDIWPGTEVRFLDAGHVSAYLLHKHTFRAAIIESFQRFKRKYVDV
ncbi:protein ABHD18 isoform X2 [Zootermopsis nevadensis]|nr:protein ABHD18 isoform X2 [Zootermopsis nevadensis]XP_021940978.1 protein ABHD18 isoform X2 [Zootermopsis nevadensis]